MLKYIFKFIFIILGWHPISKDDYNKIIKEKKLIMLFSHTSYFDFILLLLCLFIYPEIRSKIYAIVKPQLIDNYGFLFKYFNFIPSTRLEDTGNGFVKKTSEKLNSLSSFYLLISPKGTIKKSPWRSGYYWLAKQLNANIIVIGPDYQNKKIVFQNIYSVDDMSKDFLEYTLKYDMSLIHPINPQYEYLHSNYNPDLLSYINYPLFTSFLILFYIFYNNLLYGVIGFIFLSSYYYELYNNNFTNSLSPFLFYQLFLYNSNYFIINILLYIIIIFTIKNNLYKLTYINILSCILIFLNKII